MIPLICASPTNVLGLLTFIGWISGVPLLASVRAKYVPMAPSTAFCFSLIGVGLIAHLLRAALPWIPRFVALVVLAVTSAKLVEIFAGLNFGIDAWFVHNPELFEAAPTGRMAPMTALNVGFIGTGPFALTAKQFEVEDAFGTLFTEEQLHTTVTRYADLLAQEFFDRVIGDVRQFSERKSFDDDVCVVGMEVQHTG